MSDKIVKIGYKTPMPEVGLIKAIPSNNSVIIELEGSVGQWATNLTHPVEEIQNSLSIPPINKSVSKMEFVGALNYTVEEDKAPTLEDTFNELVTKWKKETGLYSTIAPKISNQNYRDIIAMGLTDTSDRIIRLILNDLKKSGGFWFHALCIITGENPVKEKNYNNLPKMREDWIEWGIKNEYLK